MSKLLPENVTVLGDPHLGRRFKTGVPLHRIGEREMSQEEDFYRSLHDCQTECHVMMGDIFDKFIVPPEIVLFAAETYNSAANQNPNVMYVILLGNHDVSRDTSRSSSFDLFKRLVAGAENIRVVDSEPVVLGSYGFAPYSVFSSADDVVNKLPNDLDAVFGHWDIVDFGGDNVIPTKLLADKGIPLAITGHDHVAREEKRHGVDILVTGSMQPYTHAEDPEGYLYVSVTLDELDPEAVVNKNVRILLREGEVLPDDLDCLSLTAKRITDEDDKIEVDTSEFEALELNVMLESILEGLTCKDQIMAQFEEARD